MKKLILSAALMFAISDWAAAQSISPQTSSKQSGPKAEEKNVQKNGKGGFLKKANKRNAGAIEVQDIKLPLPDHTSYAADSTSLAPKPKDD